jgi:hypothetical protein
MLLPWDQVELVDLLDQAEPVVTEQTVLQELLEEPVGQVLLLHLQL